MKEKSKNKPGSRFLTFLLALAILPAMQAFPAWAGEATSNPSVDLKESEETIYAAREGQPATPSTIAQKGMTAQTTPTGVISISAVIPRRKSPGAI